MNKILIIFDTDSGKAAQLAKICEQNIKDLGQTPRVCHTAPVFDNKEEKHITYDCNLVSKEDILWADGYVIISPVHTGTFTASIKYFIDEYHGLAIQKSFFNKPITAMVIGKVPHAGAETAIQQMYSCFMHWGSIIVTPTIIFEEINALNGNPYGLSFLESDLDKSECENKRNIAVKLFLQRFSEIADKLKCACSSSHDATDSTSKPHTIIDALS